MSLSNKVVLVSGANRGIGAALVTELLKTKVRKIYASARATSSLPDFADPRIVPLQLDVTSDASVQAAARTANDVDVLLNNAGSAAPSDWLSSSHEALDADMATNFYGTLRVIRAFSPKLLARRSGTIANVISVVGLAPVPALAGYSASKAALQSMTQALRASLAKSGITVVGIYPGPINTRLARDIRTQLGRDIAPELPSAEHAAINIVRGLEAGETSIFPDPTALQIEHLWANDGRQLEAALAG